MATARIVIKIKDEFFLQKETFDTNPDKIIVAKDFFAPFNLNRLGLLYIPITGVGNIEESKTLFANLLASLNLITSDIKLESLFSVTEAACPVNLMQMAKDRSDHIGENLLNYYFIEVDESRVSDILKKLNSSPKSGIDYAYLRAELSDFNDSSSVSSEVPLDLSDIAVSHAPHRLDGLFVGIKEVNASPRIAEKRVKEFKQAVPIPQNQSKDSNSATTPSLAATELPPPPLLLPPIIDSLFKNCGITNINPPIPNVTVVDVEQGWNTSILTALNISSIFGGGYNYLSPPKIKHGTNTLNVLFKGESPDNLSTYNGFCPYAVKKIASVWKTPTLALPDNPPLYDRREASLASVLGHVYVNPENIYNTNNAIVNKGDIVLLELQISSNRINNLPVEIERGMFNLIKAGIKAGFIIIESAGNGGEFFPGGRDLDDPQYSTFGAGIMPLKSNSSGAIMVGAVNTIAPYQKFLTSNFGSRIDCFCFGDKITTGTVSDSVYKYSSTSLASAIVAAMVANLQIMAKKIKKRPLDIIEIKNFLNKVPFPLPNKTPNLNTYIQTFTGYLATLPP